jgi:hypothetical protein
MTPLVQHYMSWKVLWCAFRGRHKGDVFFTNEFGPYWECHSCGAELR